MSKRHKFTLDVGVYDREIRDYVNRTVSIEIDMVSLARHLGGKANASKHGISKIQGGIIKAQIIR